MIPRTTLWVLSQHNRRLTVEVVWGDHDWEVRLFAQGVLFMWRACETRDGAVAYADLIRRAFEHDGWSLRETSRDATPTDAPTPAVTAEPRDTAFGSRSF